MVQPFLPQFRRGRPAVDKTCDTDELSGMENLSLAKFIVSRRTSMRNGVGIGNEPARLLTACAYPVPYVHEEM